MGYDDREMRLSQQRKRLQDDAVYLKEKTADLQHEARLKGVTLRGSTAENLYADRVFYGSYSEKMKRTRRARTAARHGQRSSVSPLQPRIQTIGGKAPRAAVIRALECDRGSVRELQKNMKESMRQAKINFDLEPKEKPDNAEWIEQMKLVVRNTIAAPRGEASAVNELA